MHRTTIYDFLEKLINKGLVNTVIKKNVTYYKATEPIKLMDFLKEKETHLQKILPDLLEKWHIKAYELQNISDIPKAPLKHHKIGLYRSWRSSMDEGWTRYAFDDLGVPYTTLRNKDFKGTAKGKKPQKVDFKAKYDVIVFADESADIIKSGKPSPTSRWARFFTAMPPEYEGGIGKEGIEALKTFVEKGGILVTLNSA